MNQNTNSETLKLPNSWKGTPPLLIGAGLVLLALSFALSYLFATGMTMKFFLHSYLANFMFILSFGLGATFFVIIQFLTRAGWSTSVRRMAELISTTIPFISLLFVPILLFIWLNSAELYEWVKPTPGPIAEKAKYYLNAPFFTIRTIIYFAVWILMAAWYFKTSRKQDETGDAQLTIKLQKWAGPMVMAYALTVSGAAFDWVMSINADWYSTIFGVYLFAGSMYAFFALMICLFMSLQNAGKLRDNVNVEHFHDMGKFLFGFTMFWSYIAFSQMMLYWYGNIPEETDWYRQRIQGNWLYISYGMIIMHFILPWLGTLSRHVRRHRLGLTFWACWGLFAHWLDMTYLVVPNVGEVSNFALVGHFLGGVGMLCLFLAFLIIRATDVPLVAIRDPRLHEAMSYTNPIL